MWLATSVGAASRIGPVLAAAVGSGDPAAIRRAAARDRASGCGASVVVAAVGLWLGAPLFRFMGTADAVTEAGIAYLR